MCKYLSPTIDDSQTALGSYQNLNIILSDIILKFLNDQTFVTIPTYHCNFIDLTGINFIISVKGDRFRPWTPHWMFSFPIFLLPCKSSSYLTALLWALLVVMPVLSGADYPFILLEVFLASDPCQILRILFSATSSHYFQNRKFVRGFSLSLNKGNEVLAGWKAVFFNHDRNPKRCNF